MTPLNLLQHSLLGGAAFRDVQALLDGLEWPEASQPRVALPYTLADQIYHLSVTQQASLDLASGRAQEWPEHLSVWPSEALTEAAFRAALSNLRVGLAEAQALAHDPSSRAREVLLDLAVHNAYHWGQIALIRRLNGTLPAAEEV